MIKICLLGKRTKITYEFSRLTAEFKNEISPPGRNIVAKTVEIDKKKIKVILDAIDCEAMTIGKPDPTYCQGGFVILPGKKFSTPSRKELNYHIGASGGIIIFEKNKRETFNAALEYYKELLNNTNSNFPITIVGIISDTEEVTTEEGEQLADKLNCSYFETELTNHVEIENIIHAVTKQALLQRKKTSVIN